MKIIVRVWLSIRNHTQLLTDFPPWHLFYCPLFGLSFSCLFDCLFIYLIFSFVTLLQLAINVILTVQKRIYMQNIWLEDLKRNKDFAIYLMYSPELTIFHTVQYLGAEDLAKNHSYSVYPAVQFCYMRTSQLLPKKYSFVIVNLILSLFRYTKSKVVPVSWGSKQKKIMLTRDLIVI